MFLIGNIFIICILEHIWKFNYLETTLFGRYSLFFHLSQEPHIALHDDQVLHLLWGCPGPRQSHDPPGDGEDALALAGGRRDAEDDPHYVAQQGQLLAVILPPH